MEAVEALALVTGKVEEELLLRNEYLAAENEILKSKLNKPPRFNDHERIRLANIGNKMGLIALKEIACIMIGISFGIIIKRAKMGWLNGDISSSELKSIYLRDRCKF
jgi:hypothetical protein